MCWISLMRIRQRKHLVGAVPLNELNGCVRLKPTPTNRHNMRERAHTHTHTLASDRFLSSAACRHFSFSHRNAFGRSYSKHTHITPSVLRCDHTIHRRSGFEVRLSAAVSFVRVEESHTRDGTIHNMKFRIITCIHTFGAFDTHSAIDSRYTQYRSRTLL